MADHSQIEQIRRAMGPPAFERNGILLYHGDCASLMKKMPSFVVDLAITSPPYNIGKEYEDLMQVTQYVEWCSEWITEVARLLHPNGAFWLNLGYCPLPTRAKALPISYLLWDKVPLYLIQEVVWNYGAGVAARNSFSPRNEKFLWYVNNKDRYAFNLDEVRDPNVKYPNQKKNGKLKCNPRGKNPSDVWAFPKVTSGHQRSSQERTAHPAQFPLAVIERIVRACSNPGGVLFDPFLGSGTVAEVAIRAGRHAVGVEIRDDYLKIAIDRIEAACNELENHLFAAPDESNQLNQLRLIGDRPEVSLLPSGGFLGDPVGMVEPAETDAQ